MKLSRLLLALALAASARGAGPVETVSLTVARRGTPGRPASIAMATVPLTELRDWLGRRAGWDPVHVEVEADVRGGLPTLRVTDDEGRVRTSLARSRDLTRARALIEAAMRTEPEVPVPDPTELAGVPVLGTRG
jgi:hypothetical protein